MNKQENVDQQITISNTGEFKFDSIHFNQGDYVQVLQCFTNFKNQSNNNNDNDDNDDNNDNNDDNNDDDIQRLQDEIDDMRSDIDAIITDMGGLNNNIIELQSDIEAIQQTLNELNEEDINLQNQIDDIKSQITNLQRQINYIVQNINGKDSNNVKGQFSVEVSRKRTNTNLQGSLQSQEDLDMQKIRQFVFKFDSECEPKDIVDSLEANEVFMQWFLPVWDEQANQFTIYAKNGLQNSFIIFRASGTVSQMLGLTEQKYMITEPYEDLRNGQLLNVWTNYPRMNQAFTLAIQCDQTQNYTQNFTFTGFYNHNDIRRALIGLHTLYYNDAPFIQFTIEFEYDSSDQRIYPVLVIRRVYTGDTTQFNSINLQIQITPQVRQATNTIFNDTLTYNDVDLLTEDYKILQMSSTGIYLGDGGAFKPDCQYRYSTSEVDEFLNGNANIARIFAFQNYPNQVQIQFCDMTTNTNYSWTGGNGGSSAYRIDEYYDATNWQNMPIYPVRDQSEQDYYKVRFIYQDWYSDLEGHIMRWSMGNQYNYWFDRWQVLINNKLSSVQTHTTSKTISQNSYIQGFNDQIDFSIDIQNSGTISFAYQSSSRVQDLISARNTQYSETLTEYNDLSTAKFNHNDFRNIWCGIYQTATGYYHMDYDYTNERWFIRIHVPQNDSYTLHINTFPKTIDDMRFVSTNIQEFNENNDTDLTNTNITLQGGDSEQGTTFEIYTTNTKATPCTNNLDTNQTIDEDVNSPYQLDLQTIWDNNIGQFQNDAALIWKDCLTQEQFTFNFSSGCSFYHMGDELSADTNISKYMGVYYGSEYEYELYMKMAKDVYDFERLIVSGEIVLIELINEGGLGLWLDITEGLFMGSGNFYIPKRRNSDNMMYNFVRFNFTDYWQLNSEEGKQQIRQRIQHIGNNFLTQLQNVQSQLRAKHPIQVQHMITSATQSLQCLYLWCNDLKATYSINLQEYENNKPQTTNQRMNRNGLVAVITQNEYQPQHQMLYKIQGSAQPITFKLTTDINGYENYQQNGVLQVQFLKQEVVE